MKFITKATILGFFALILSSCSSQGGIWHPMGTIAAHEKYLLILTTSLMLLVVVPVIILTLWICYRYRDGAGGTYRPKWTHSTTLEVVCWGIPTVIIVALAVIVWDTTHELSPYKPLESDKKPVVIEVVALDWKWMFIYPEQKIATINYIKIPTDRPIDFRITSAAPMNSFMIPQLGGQIYAMTGMVTQLHLLATHEGRYRGFSANYTGMGFSEMQFYVDATSDKNFNSWVKHVKEGGHKTLTSNYFWENLVKQTIDDPVTYYSNVDENMFDGIKDAYMMPKDREMVMKNAGAHIHH